MSFFCFETRRKVKSSHDHDPLTNIRLSSSKIDAVLRATLSETSFRARGVSCRFILSICSWRWHAASGEWVDCLKFGMRTTNTSAFTGVHAMRLLQRFRRHRSASKLSREPLVVPHHAPKFSIHTYTGGFGNCSTNKACTNSNPQRLSAWLCQCTEYNVAPDRSCLATTFLFTFQAHSSQSIGFLCTANALSFFPLAR